jgi:hypothetical protein
VLAEVRARLEPLLHQQASYSTTQEGHSDKNKRIEPAKAV